MNCKTIRDVAYKSKRTIKMKRDKYALNFLRAFGKLPRQNQYPTYELLPRNETSNIGKNRIERNVDNEMLIDDEHEMSNNIVNEDVDKNDQHNGNESDSNGERDNNDDNEMSDDDADSNNYEEMRGNFNSNCNFINDAPGVENHNNDHNNEAAHASQKNSTSRNDYSNVDPDDDPDDDPADDDNIPDINENENEDEDASAFSIKQGPQVFLREHVREDEILIKIMAIAVRHSLNMTTILDIIIFVKSLLIGSTLPTTRNSLWTKLGKKEDSVQTRNYYCENCLDVIGTGNEPVRECYCKKRGPGKELKPTSFFISLNLIEQLKRILSIQNIIRLLQYPQNRKKINTEAGIEDLYDGEEYKKLREPECFLSNEWNFSFTINTDGCQVAKSSKDAAWPILLTINELPPHARKRFMILAGIWVDKTHPDLNVTMLPVVKDLIFLYNTGITWKPYAEKTVCSKFITNISCVDSVARSSLLNMTRFNGRYGCPTCYATGEKYESTLRWVYPAIEFELRTDREIRSDIDAAKNSKNRVRGIIGDTVFKYLPEFNLDRGIVIDSMHNMWLGVAKSLTTKVLEAKVTDAWYVASNNTLQVRINDRLEKIRTPSRIARKPRGVEYCHVWKASEWRNWILYYCVPCLKDIIPVECATLFYRISEAAHILNGATVTGEEIEKARSLIESFVKEYEQLMGLENMSYNIHILRHVPDCVKHWGPLWTHTAFPYEGYNRHIISSLKSPNGRQLQIMNQYILNDFIRSVSNDPTIDRNIKQYVTNTLNSGKNKIIVNHHDYDRNKKFEGLTRYRVENISPEESTALRTAGQICYDIMKVFKKAVINGTLYVSNESDNTNAKSCDKYICSKTGLFARIDKIVSVVNHDGHDINGAFVTYFETTNDGSEASHIRTLCESRRGFVVAADIILPVIIMKINGILYGVQLTNTWETD